MTSLEYDHADIYPDFETYQLAFKRLVNLVPRRGRVVWLIWIAAIAGAAALGWVISDLVMPGGGSLISQVRTMAVPPIGGPFTLVDDTGGIVIVFVGRQQIAGLRLGAMVEAEGTVIESRGSLALLNPRYTLLP